MELIIILILTIVVVILLNIMMWTNESELYIVKAIASIVSLVFIGGMSWVLFNMVRLMVLLNM